jgi:hypothetical protein
MSLRHPLAVEGEYGWLFRIDTDLDATSVNTVQIRFTAPDGTVTDKTASAVTTAADGDYYWTVTDGFFTPGQWTARLVFTWTATKVIKGKLHRFTIADAEA